MSDIKWFAEKLLELFVKQRECYRNIFGASQHYLRSIHALWAICSDPMVSLLYCFISSERVYIFKEHLFYHQVIFLRLILEVE